MLCYQEYKFWKLDEVYIQKFEEILNENQMENIYFLPHCEDIED